MLRSNLMEIIGMKVTGIEGNVMFQFGGSYWNVSYWSKRGCHLLEGMGMMWKLMECKLLVRNCNVSYRNRTECHLLEGMEWKLLEFELQK